MHMMGKRAEQFQSAQPQVGGLPKDSLWLEPPQNSGGLTRLLGSYLRCREDVRRLAALAARQQASWCRVNNAQSLSRVAHSLLGLKRPQWL